MPDDWDQDENWTDDEDDDPDDALVAPCPECRTPVSAITEKCPTCGYWLSEADVRSMRPDKVWPAKGPRIVAAGLLAIFLLALIVAGFAIF